MDGDQWEIQRNLTGSNDHNDSHWESIGMEPFDKGTANYQFVDETLMAGYQNKAVSYRVRRISTADWGWSTSVGIAEAFQSHQHQMRGIGANGTVCCIHNDPGGLLNPIQNTQLRFALQNFTNHIGQLSQANTAGDTLTTGLRLTQIQKVQRHIYRAQSGRTGGNALLHVSV